MVGEKEEEGRIGANEEARGTVCHRGREEEVIKARKGGGGGRYHGGGREGIVGKEAEEEGMIVGEKAKEAGARDGEIFKRKRKEKDRGTCANDEKEKSRNQVLGQKTLGEKKADKIFIFGWQCIDGKSISSETCRPKIYRQQYR